MKTRILILIFAFLVTITPLLAYGAEYLVDFKGQTYMSKIISVLPDDADHPKLLRVLDKEAGVVCYILQNDTADFYSGLQCINVGKFHSVFEPDRSMGSIK